MLAKSGKVKVVQRIIASNPRITQMPGYGTGTVFAAQQSGGQLLVYVFLFPPRSGCRRGRG